MALSFWSWHQGTPVAVTLQAMLNVTVVAGGMLGMAMPGPTMLATVRLAGIGHKAAPTAVQLIEVQLRPDEGVSLNKALLTVTTPTPVPLATVTV